MIVILNAPAGVGKDTIADMLKNEHNFAKSEFKSTMFKAALGLSGLTEDEYMSRYNDRKLKELSWDKLGGLSCRGFMIHISEDIMKPLFGNDVFGKRAAAACYSAIDFGFPNVVFSDGGFIDEVKALHDSGLDVVVVRLHRDGHTFEGDSRRYLYPDFCRSFDVALQEGLPILAVKEILEQLS